jgi:UDP-3-O-[3-hydroxymyristoyl] glucosamine N-acyltransferase
MRIHEAGHKDASPNIQPFFVWKMGQKVGRGASFQNGCAIYQNRTIGNYAQVTKPVTALGVFG